jgi:AmpD protein
MARGARARRALAAAFGPVDAAGWLAGARRRESPNRDARPAHCAIELLVIHCISLPPGALGTADIERLFANELDPDAHAAYAALRGLRVSAHFLVARDGALTQFVSCAERAWHAGRSSWNGRPACNDYSIGIELVGSEFEPFCAAQYGTLAVLLEALRAAYPIRATLGHGEIAPGRKFDPGPLFDWSRLARGAA